jgi:hypothetical protein
MTPRRVKGSAGKGPGLSGSAPRVRFLPPGVSGEDLVAETFERLRPRAVWLRGEQRVRIRTVTTQTVTFAELDHGQSRCRRLSRSAFLRSSSPE